MNYVNDITLYNVEKETVNLIVEICPGTSDKTELVGPGFEKLLCVRQVEGTYPFYYGSFPRTYAEDKDPLDFILFTDIQHNPLEVVEADVIGAVKTIDAGERDDKIICVESSCKLKNLKRHMKKALKFLKSYKGKDADMVIEKKLASREEAELLVKESHEAWSRQKRVKTAVIATTSKKAQSLEDVKNSIQTRLRIIKR